MISANTIDGWMSDAELEWLAAQAVQMSSIVEIGAWKGRSTHALLSACKGPVYAVDHWLGSPGERNTFHAEARTSDVFAQFMANVGHFENLQVIRGNTRQIYSQVPEADMVFIDGSHEYRDVLYDIRTFGPKAKRLLCGHDFNDERVQRAVRDSLGAISGTAETIWYKELA